MTAEEVFQFEDAAGRVHEFQGGDARHRRFMQPQRFGDLAQYQGPHRDFAVLQEVALAVNDGLRHAQYGFEALLHVLDQPLRFLQLRIQLLGAAAAVALQDVGIHPVHAQARHGVGIQRGNPYALGLAHDHIGDHKPRFL